MCLRVLGICILNQYYLVKTCYAELLIRIFIPVMISLHQVKENLLNYGFTINVPAIPTP